MFLKILFISCCDLINMDGKEQYPATKLWNEVIKAFQSGMPLKKHRRNIHMYHDCFSASDAATWLHCYLLNNSSFGPDVTRQQAINLLGKFLKCRVIECITVKTKKIQFCDNSHLYRFTHVSPQQFKTLPLRLVQSPSLKNDEKETGKLSKSKKKYLSEFQKENIPECLFVEKKMSLMELGLIWKTATVSRLEHLLSDLDLNKILDDKSISGQVINHNVCRISKTGVVSLIDKTDDIPPWVISAMKCLANWPNASGSGSCLPNYPGFEKDVFKVVRDFFINPQIPLLPNFLSSAMIAVFNHFLYDQIEDIYDDQNSLKKNKRNSNYYSPLLSTAVKTSTPALNTDKNNLPSKYGSFSENKDGKLLLDNPEVMWDYPSMVYFETDFGTSNPVTKVVPSPSDLYASSDYLRGSMESVSTISVCSVNYSNNNCLSPTTPLKNWLSDSCLRESKKNILTSQSMQLERNMPVEHCNKQSQSMFDLLFIDDSGGDEKLNTSVCSSKTLTEEEDKMPLCNFEDKELNVSAISNQNLCSAIYKKSSHLSQCSHVLESSKLRNNLNIFKEIIYPSELKLSFQLLLLFLNPSNRRQIHLLFRVVNKILKNQKFILDVHMPMRDYLLQTFLPAIVQSNINQNILLGIVSFLLDNCETVFQPPTGLKEEVEELSKLRSGRIVYSVDDTCFLTYCEMVSKQQYEEQKVSMSAEALKSLLHSVIIDEKLSEKERKRRIKQFKESHPDIYYELFPGKHNNLVKSRSTFLNRFASLRM